MPEVAAAGSAAGGAAAVAGAAAGSCRRARASSTRCRWSPDGRSRRDGADRHRRRGPSGPRRSMSCVRRTRRREPAPEWPRARSSTGATQPAAGRAGAAAHGAAACDRRPGGRRGARASRSPTVDAGGERRRCEDGDARSSAATAATAAPPAPAARSATAGPPPVARGRPSSQGEAASRPSRPRAASSGRGARAGARRPRSARAWRPPRAAAPLDGGLHQGVTLLGRTRRTPASVSRIQAAARAGRRGREDREQAPDRAGRGRHGPRAWQRGSSRAARSGAAIRAGAPPRPPPRAPPRRS